MASFSICNDTREEVFFKKIVLCRVQALIAKMPSLKLKPFIYGRSLAPMMSEHKA